MKDKELSISNKLTNTLRHIRAVDKAKVVFKLLDDAVISFSSF